MQTRLCYSFLILKKPSGICFIVCFGQSALAMRQHRVKFLWSFLHKLSKMTVNLVKLQQEDRVICSNKSAEFLLLEKLVRSWNWNTGEAREKFQLAVKGKPWLSGLFQHCLILLVYAWCSSFSQTHTHALACLQKHSIIVLYYW